MRTPTRIAALLLVFAACTDRVDPVITPPPPPPPPPAPPGLLVSGSDMSGTHQNINVSRDGASVTTATVAVNGTAMTHAGFGAYQGTVTPGVAVGGQVTVVVSDGGQTATGVGLVPSVATIADPPATTRGNPLLVSWAATVSPDTFYVGLNYTVAGSSYSSFVRTAGTLRQASVPTDIVPVGATGLSITVFGYNVGLFTGDFATGSNMRVRSLGADKPFAFAGP